MNAFPYVLLGLFSGFLGGLLGIGGGVFVIAALAFIFGFSQHQAQGTTLAALLPPAGIFAAYLYYKEGYVNLKVACLLCVGFFFGAALGAKLATHLSTSVLEKVFGMLLLVLGIKMVFLR
jgi:uncharacterized membrane protein YfcA